MSSMHSERLIWKPIEHEKGFMTRNWYKPKNVHAVITAQTKQIKSDYEIKLKQQEIVQEVGNANMLTKALIDRLINKVYVFPGDRIEIEYATQDFLETKESEKEV